MVIYSPKIILRDQWGGADLAGWEVGYKRSDARNRWGTPSRGFPLRQPLLRIPPPSHQFFNKNSATYIRIQPLGSLQGNVFRIKLSGCRVFLFSSSTALVGHPHPATVLAISGSPPWQKPTYAGPGSTFRDARRRAVRTARTLLARLTIPLETHETHALPFIILLYYYIYYIIICHIYIPNDVATGLRRGGKTVAKEHMFKAVCV